MNKRSDQNQMTAKNLGVCVGPSLMWGLTSSPIKESATIIECLILNCRHVFGPHVVSLLGEPTPDSGAEESDSLHCKYWLIKFTSEALEICDIWVMLSTSCGIDSITHTKKRGNRSRPPISASEICGRHRQEGVTAATNLSEITSRPIIWRDFLSLQDRCSGVIL